MNWKGPALATCTGWIALFLQKEAGRSCWEHGWRPWLWSRLLLFAAPCFGLLHRAWLWRPIMTFVINILRIKDFVLTWETRWTILSVLHSLIDLKSSSDTVVNTFAKSSEACKNLSRSALCSRVKNSSENLVSLSLYSCYENWAPILYCLY